MDPFLAEIRIYPFEFAPKAWAYCNGQLMPISQNTALFALLGTFYGGDGKSTFALPNLLDSAPMHWGSSSQGLSNRSIGEQGGSQSVTLLQSEMPVHTHTLQAFATPADLKEPQDGAVLTVYVQNLGAEEAPRQGEQVSLAWKPEYTFAVTPQDDLVLEEDDE